MTIEEIKSDIDNLKESLKDEGLTDEDREMLQEALKKAESQLRSLQSKKKPMTRLEFFQALDSTNEGLTKKSVNLLSDDGYEALRQKLIAQGNEVDSSKLEGWVDYYLTKHIPKGTDEKAEPDKPKTPAPASKTKAPKQKEDNKTLPKPPAPKAKPKQEVVYTYRKKADISQMKRVAMCDLYAMPVNKTILVEMIRGSQVTAKPGDYLLFNEEGYLHTIMTESSYAKRCRKPIETVPRSKYDELVKEVNALKAKAEKQKSIEADLRAKLEAKKQKPEPKPVPKPKAPAKTGGSKTDAGQPAGSGSKKRHSCTATQQQLGNVTAKMVKFVRDNMWEKAFAKKEILGIFQRKTSSGKIEVIAKIKHYKMIGTDTSWYKVCTHSLNLTKVNPPAQGTYKSLVSKTEMKVLHQTLRSGPTKATAKATYNKCLKIYRSWYQCQQSGTCTADDKNKLSVAYRTCGDLHKKFEVVPEWMDGVYDYVRENRKKDEGFWQAFSRLFEKEVAKAA